MSAEPSQPDSPPSTSRTGAPAKAPPPLAGVAEALTSLDRELYAWQRSLGEVAAAAAALRLQLSAATGRRTRGRPPSRRPPASVRRRLAVNAVSAAATAFILAAIASAAYAFELRQAHVSLPSHRLIGVTTDPWHSDEWGRALGGRIDIVANFMAWGYGKSPRKRFAEAQRRRLIPLVTWEPWTPRAGTASGAPQPRFANAAIARGDHDAYVRSFARESARFKGPILLRFAHEMNGSWYPWHHDSRSYVAAWRRIHGIFRAEGATNVIFVWAPNLPLGYYQIEKWRRDVRAYWPGAGYVDWVGTTTIGRKQNTVGYYARRVELLRTYRKPVILAEAFAVYPMRSSWLPELREWVRRSPWIRAVVWSESPKARSLQVDPRRHHFGRMIRDARGR